MAEVKSMSQLIEEVSPYYKKKKEPEAERYLFRSQKSKSDKRRYDVYLQLV